MVAITSFSVKRSIAFSSQQKPWVFVPFLMISRVIDAARDEYFTKAQTGQPDKVISRDSSGNMQHSDELRKHLLSQHHLSVADKEAQKNLDAKVINIGINENLAFDFNRLEWLYFRGSVLGWYRVVACFMAMSALHRA